MNARTVLLLGIALVTAPLASACSTTSAPDESSPDGAAPDAASANDDDAGSTTSSGDAASASPDSGTSSEAPDSALTSDDAGTAGHGAGGRDASGDAESGQCIRPPYQTTNECTGIGMPGGPVIPSCSQFNASGQLVCPTIPGCTVVPDPSGQYCEGDNVTCGLSDCGHICLLPNWDPCYDVATGKCLEGC